MYDIRFIDTGNMALESSKFYLAEVNCGIEYGQANYGIGSRKYLLGLE